MPFLHARVAGLDITPMAKGQETELKLAASPAMLLHLRGHPLLAEEDREFLSTCFVDSGQLAVLRQCDRAERVAECVNGFEATVLEKAYSAMSGRLI